jgi:hypothetical protein
MPSIVPNLWFDTAALEAVIEAAANAVAVS